MAPHWNPLAKVNGRPLNILITIASTIGFLLFGYDNGIFSGIIINPWFLETFHDPSPSLLGTVSATYNLGGFAGSVIAFFCGHLLGRRRTILVGIAITTIGAIPFCVATNIGTLVAGRTICGAGVGVMSSTVGLWQAETVPSQIRGRYLVMQLLFGAAFGLFLAQWINYSYFANTGREAFVVPVAVQLIFLLIAGILVVLLPESPRWLAKYDRIDEAVEILTRLVGPEDARHSIVQIVETNELEKRVEGNQFKALVSQGASQNFRRVCLACGVMISRPGRQDQLILRLNSDLTSSVHQLTGINSVTYYMPTLLETFLSTGHRETLWIAGLSSVDSMVCVLFCVLTVDRFGRKPFLFYGSLFQSVIFIIIASLLGTSPPGNYSFGVAAVVMIFIFYGGNAFCWLGVSWAYPAEILPLQIREKGLALGNVCYWLFQFMMVEITPIAIANIYYRFYIILAVFNVCIAILVWIFFPETKKKSLEELDFYFAKKYGNESQIKEIEMEAEKKNDVVHLEDTNE